mgnify:CR=1 FL=1
MTIFGIETSCDETAAAVVKNGVEEVCSVVASSKEFHEKTGRKVGMKPAGGVSNSYDAALFYTIVEQVLGQEWLYPGLFRFGTSRLADVLLSDILGKDVKYFSTSSSAKY